MAHYKLDQAKVELQEYILKLKAELQALKSIEIVTKKDGTEFANLLKNFKVNNEDARLSLEDKEITLHYATETRKFHRFIFYTYNKDFSNKSISEIKTDFDKRSEQVQSYLSNAERKFSEWDIKVKEVEAIYEKFIYEIQRVDASPFITKTMIDIHSVKLM